MRLSEAFLRGKGEHVILKLDPESPLTTTAIGGLVASAAEARAEMIDNLQSKNDVLAKNQLRKAADRLRAETLTHWRKHVTDPSVWNADADSSLPLAQVWTAIFNLYGDRMREVIGAGTAAIDFAPDLTEIVGRSLVGLFEAERPINVSPAARGAGRLVASVAGYVLVGYAVASRQYRAIEFLSRPPAKSDYGYVLPWTLIPEFRHHEALGHIQASGDAILAFAKSLDLGPDNVSAEQLANGMRSADVLLNLLALGRGQEFPTVYAWGTNTGLGNAETLLQDLALDTSLQTVVERLAGEAWPIFRSRTVARVIDLHQRSQAARRIPSFSVLDPAIVQLFRDEV
jgi:hypothetical protein